MSITGWIVAFFPYLKDQEGMPTQKNAWLAEGGAKLRLLMAGEWGEKPGPIVNGMSLVLPRSGPSLGDFPGGLARAPFTWVYLTQTFDMESLGGFVGVVQDPSTLTLRPEIGWAIRHAPA